MALSATQVGQFQYAYETLEDVETLIRTADREAADALKRARRELETYARRSGFNNLGGAATTGSGVTAAGSLPRRGRISK